MHEMAASLYPRGFITRAGLGAPLPSPRTAGFRNAVTEVDGDPALNAIFDISREGVVNLMAWDYRSKALNAFSKLYGNFHLWVYTQAVQNPYCYDLAFEFLCDTLDYIATGQRRLSVQTWLELLQEHPEQRLSIDHNGRYEKEIKARLEKIGTDENAIAKWCQHPEGFTDLLFATNIFFGRAIQPKYNIKPKIKMM